MRGGARLLGEAINPGSSEKEAAHASGEARAAFRVG